MSTLLQHRSLLVRAATVWFALYGVLLGTNSFAEPTPTGPMAPTVAVLWSRSGLREWTAYLLTAAALAPVPVWRQRSWLAFRTERLRPWSEVRVAWPEALALTAALALVAWSACVETQQLIQGR